MKGITHFITGVAVASCFPSVAASLYTTKGLLMPLGGVFGVLPDTVDFRLLRYLWTYQRVVTMDEANLDPKAAAEAMAKAMDDAAASNDPVTLRLDIVRVTSSYYRTYLVYVDDKRKEVTALMGPLKTMSHVMEKAAYMPPGWKVREAIQKKGPAQAYRDLFDILPCLPESAPEGEESHHTAKFTADIDNTYYGETEVGIFSGPDFSFHKKADGRVRIDFIPWHRGWSHSWMFGILMGPIAFLFMVLVGLIAGEGFLSAAPLTAALIAIFAVWSHIAEDQVGHLGSSLWWPVLNDRTVGMKMTSSASPFTNTLFIWISLAVLIFNLNAYAPVPSFTLPWTADMSGNFTQWDYWFISLLNYLTYVVVIPWSLYAGLRHLFRSDEEREYSMVESFDTASSYAGEQSDS